jgi:hypothetical protein
MDNIAPKEMRNSDGGLKRARKHRRVREEKRETGAKRMPEKFYHLIENKRITVF